MNRSLILASQSPRRKYLLEQIGLVFSVIPSSFDESLIQFATPKSYTKALAEAKIKDIASKYPNAWVIGADTVVVVKGTRLGKPKSKNEARKMLTKLNGIIHHVYTGYSICCIEEDKKFTDYVKTDVLFKKLSKEEIEYYINTKEPFDKAGAYAVQGIGTFLVKSIKGSYTNVVGLPICEVMELLIREKIVKLS